MREIVEPSIYSCLQNTYALVTPCAKWYRPYIGPEEIVTVVLIHIASRNPGLRLRLD